MVVGSDNASPMGHILANKSQVPGMENTLGAVGLDSPRDSQNNISFCSCSLLLPSI